MKLFGLTFFEKKQTSTADRLPPIASYGNSHHGRSITSYRSDGSKYIGGISGVSNPMYYDHYAIRRNARNAYQDSVHAHGIVSRRQDTVADIGLKLDASPNWKLLGITPERAEEWAADVESRFHLWARDKKQHRAENMSWYQTHRLYQGDDEKDGENFVRFFYSKERKLQNPLQFEFIDPDQIRGDAYTSTQGPYHTNDGIIRDNRGREKAYNIWVSKYTNNRYYIKNETIPRIGEKSKRVMMIHGFTPEFPGQKRGFSKLTHCLQEFQNITDFTLAQIKKAINQSNLVMAIENNLQDPSNPTEDMPLTPPGGEGYGVIAETDPTGDSAGTSETDLHYTPMNEVDMTVPGSTAYFNTRMGDKIKAFENTAPSDSYETFKNAFITDLAASRGMPAEVLQMKFNSSYSSARAALVMFWRVALIWREEMATDYLNPTYEMWLNEEIAAGRITAPGWNDPILKNAWMNCSWVGSPMPNIDPMREAKANKENLAMSLTTVDRAAREQNGSDAKTNIMKNKKTFTEMPVPFWEDKGINNG